MTYRDFRGVADPTPNSIMLSLCTGYAAPLPEKLRVEVSGDPTHFTIGVNMAPRRNLSVVGFSVAPREDVVL